MELLKTYLALFFVLVLGSESSSQNCPYNIDFEQGSFGMWDCFTGSFDNGAGSNNINWSGFTEDPNRHLLISEGDTSTDEYGNFPRLCPNGSGFSVKLGNDQIGGLAEGISYIFAVPNAVSNFSIFFHYAIVLEDPSHAPEQQPRFRARIINMDDNMPLECVNFDFSASAVLPGFQSSLVKPNVIFKDWTPITLNLTPYAGKTLKLEFISSDCTLRGHFGYAYVDVSGTCNGAIAGSIVCEGDVSSTLTAPFGFAAYTWYSNTSFNTILSNGQTLTISPPPANGNTYPVIIVPYPGFGCRDTLYATITSSPKPVAFAGNDRTVCTYESTQLGKPPDPGLKYSWEPASELINNRTSNPFTKLNLPAERTFLLTVVDPQTGCIGNDEVVVTPVIIDTSLSVSGDLIFCGQDPRNTFLQVTMPGVTVQWYANNLAIPGANGFQHDPRPLSTTTYFASLGLSGCYDSTKEITVTIPPDPHASFRPERKLQCVQIPVTFLNASRISNNDSLTFVWRLANGEEFTDKDLVTQFNTAGLQAITLKAISPLGCSDSVTQVFEIVENCHVDIPTAFTPNNDGLNDIFKPTLNGIKALRRFAVFDRWGNAIYNTNVIDEGWDGKHKGIPLLTGTFVWIVEYDSYERDKIVLKGTVTLIR